MGERLNTRVIAMKEKILEYIETSFKEDENLTELEIEDLYSDLNPDNDQQTNLLINKLLFEMKDEIPHKLITYNFHEVEMIQRIVRKEDK